MELDSALNQWVDSIPEHRQSFLTIIMGEADSWYCSSLGPKPEEYDFLEPICSPLHDLLRATNCHTPPVPILASQHTGVFPIACYLYERRTIVSTRP